MPAIVYGQSRFSSAQVRRDHRKRAIVAAGENLGVASAHSLREPPPGRMNFRAAVTALAQARPMQRRSPSLAP
jgi:hypothetical protein